ncbi:MAG: AEC family transporter [Pseudomonas sp.]|uniref:AEC family transporter n=1 Tax=Pseudomonas abieticivorans TaxID=2931382 RepID=UPI0020C18392|nr:AEC family transporter [Pseudomonas sp. PIA16]MDE1165378.1 AEC family transporter [Pseudomonas sp.]
MLEVLGITAPIFILIGLGYLASTLNVLSREQMRGVGTFVITFAMPALVIKALAQRPIGEVFNAHYLLAYGLASLGSFAVGMAVFYKWRKATLENSAIAAMGMSVSNSGFIGYPIAAMIAGDQAVVALALGMIIENLVMIPLALALAEAGQQQGGSTKVVLLETLRRLSRNPLIVAIIIGGSLSLSGWRIPVAPLKVIDMLSLAAAPAALFVIGGVLYGTKVRGQLGEIGLISSGKLVVHPLLVGLMFWLFHDLPLPMMLAGLVLASAPMMSVYPILGQRYGVEGRCAAALVITTLASFFTISLLLIVMRG